MKHLGAIIRKERKKIALKIYEFARKVGVSAVYITQIEKHGQLPSPVIMKRISNILHDKQLFNLYLKMKYPMVSSKSKTWEINSKFRITGEDLLNELRRIRVILEKIEKRIN